MNHREVELYRSLFRTVFVFVIVSFFVVIGGKILNSTADEIWNNERKYYDSGLYDHEARHTKKIRLDCVFCNPKSFNHSNSIILKNERGAK